MARIYGQSGCTDLLIQGVRNRGLTNLNSLKDITYFRNHFSELMREVIEHAKEALTEEIKSLKNRIAQFVAGMKVNIVNRESMLLAEKEQIREQVNSSPNLKIPKRLKILENKFEKELKKPLKKNKKTIDKMIKQCEKMELNYDTTISKRTKKKIKQMHSSKQFLERKSGFIPGAIGEESVIRKLIELPDSFIIFNDVRLNLGKSIRWKKYNEYVKSCQIDHVVIGPSGIFLIETKNWNPATLHQTSFLPHKQVDRAGYIFFIKFIKLFRKLRRKIPIRSIVVFTREWPDLNYPQVKQLTPRELIPYILYFPRELMDDEIDLATQWLVRVSD